MNKNPGEIRTEVSKAYAERVMRRAPGSCGTSVLAQREAAATAVGYSSEEVAALPADAVASSFGCGNPVGLAGLGIGDVVLDLGSGAGIDLLLAAKRVGPTGRAIGVDMTDEMISKANKNIRAENLTNVEVRKGLIEDLPVENASVDWVISNCVINLSPEKPRVFREIARVLKPGGQMLISDIVAKDLPEELLTIPALYSSCVTGAISEEDYLAGLREAGLIDVVARDRLIYDADQIAGFAATALEEAGGCGGCRPQLAMDRLRNFANILEGKIWSVRVYGRKPS